MTMRKLTTVQSVFPISGRGLVYVLESHKDWPPDLKVRIGDECEFRRSDGGVVKTRFQAIEWVDNPSQRQSWPAVLLDPQVSREDIPVGAELYVGDGASD